MHGPLEVPSVYRDMYSHVEDEDRQIYLGMATAMDDAVGNVTSALKEAGMYEDSVILFFSDNGGPAGNWPPGDIGDSGFGASNWPLRGAKFTMWEGGARTVAFITAPGLLAPR